MTKRGNGEGSIYQDSRGLWRGSVSLEGGKRKYLSGRTRHDVAKKLTAALDAQEKGLPPTDETLTVGVFLEDWLNGTAKKKVRTSTFDSYEYIVRYHLTPALGKRPLARLTPREVQAFLNSRSELGLAPRTVQYTRTVLRMALGQAQKWGLVHRNVAALAEPAKGPARQIDPLEAEQAAQLLAVARGHSQEYLLTAALGTVYGKVSCSACAGAMSTWTPGASGYAMRSNTAMADPGASSSQSPRAASGRCP